MNIERLRARLSRVALLSALGATINDLSVSRILSWEEWPGPEDPRVEDINTRMQSMYDGLASMDEKVWTMAIDIATNIAAQSVPYIHDEDAWYGPNAAVWMAAWAFALEELYTCHCLPIPADVCAQLFWYERGHWPCALVGHGDKVEDYVVY